MTGLGEKFLQKVPMLEANLFTYSFCLLVAIILLGWIPISAIINSALSKPMPSTFLLEISLERLGSPRLTYNLVAVLALTW